MCCVAERAERATSGVSAVVAVLTGCAERAFLLAFLSAVQGHVLLMFNK